MSERRFTDQEVALVLQRASSLESQAPESLPGRGLSLTDLEQIAAEVGISPALLSRAVAELDSTRGIQRKGLLGPAGVAKGIHVVPRGLPRESVLELVHAVDDSADLHGTVNEALGEVRWTGSSRFRGTQVAFGPGADETVIRVEERLNGRARKAAHLVPGAVGTALAIGVAGAAGVAGLGLLGLAAGGAVAGLGSGRALWRALCRQSERRVASLLGSLAHRASE